MATGKAGIRPDEWLIPLLFTAAAAWLVWHLSAFTLDWVPPADQSAFDRLSAQYQRNDVTPGTSGLFGGYADIFDHAALAGVIILGAIGVARVRKSPMEQYDWTVLDRISVFIGRVAMVMIVLLVSVMLYEVMLRYVFEAPTLWANELSLWLAGFIFLMAGLYAMQQRSHIRIFLVYDLLPRNAQRVCDTISTLLILVFTFAIIWGGYGEATSQFYRWETLGTAFDPPIPATLSPAILIVITLVAIQAVSNLIRDWGREAEIHTDEFDEQEIEELRRTLGADKDA
ncbi:MAG: TRAP transporter small permease subunit [Pseudomonadota bacterium]